MFRHDPAQNTKIRRLTWPRPARHFPYCIEGKRGKHFHSHSFQRHMESSHTEFDRKRTMNVESKVTPRRDHEDPEG